MTKKPKKKIFISYRRENGADLAGRICDRLKERGYEVFMDIEDLRNGLFGTALFNAIESSSDVIVVLTPGSLDRCVNQNDWVRAEIAEAIKRKKNIIPVMARGFSFDGLQLPEEIAQLPYYSGVAASHELFDASMDKLTSKLVGGRKKRISKMAAGVGVVAIVYAIGFTTWQTNQQNHVLPGSNVSLTELAETLNSVGLDASALKKVERELDELRKSSSNTSGIHSIETLLATKTTACVSNKLHDALELISNWDELPEYVEWKQHLSSVESGSTKGWWPAWSSCHSVVMNAQSVLADKVSEARSTADAQVSSSSATEAASWSPDSWRTAIDYYNKGVRAQRASRWREAWTNFAAFETNARQALVEAGSLRSQYVSAKSSYQKISLCLTKKEIRPLLAEYAGEDLFHLENFASLAELQKSPEGLANYTNAIAFWPRVVGTAVTNLLESGMKALAEKQYDSGFQAIKNAMILAESTELHERSKWTGQAANLRNQLLALAPRPIPSNAEPPKKTNASHDQAFPPPSAASVYLDSASQDPSKFLGVFKEFQDRFESVGKDRIHDRLLKKTWIFIPNLLNWEDAEIKAKQMGARLPAIAELKTLITQEPEGSGKIFINTGYFLQSFRTPKCWTSENNVLGFSQKYYVDFEKQTWETTSKSEMNHVLLIQDK